jgi:hypothetical protein
MLVVCMHTVLVFVLSSWTLEVMCAELICNVVSMQAPVPAQLWVALSNAAQVLLDVLQSAEAACEDNTGSLTSAAIAAAVGRVTKVRR